MMFTVPNPNWITSIVELLWASVPITFGNNVSNANSEFYNLMVIQSKLPRHSITGVNLYVFPNSIRNKTNSESFRRKLAGGFFNHEKVSRSLSQASSAAMLLNDSQNLAISDEINGLVEKSKTPFNFMTERNHFTGSWAADRHWCRRKTSSSSHKQSQRTYIHWPLFTNRYANSVIYRSRTSRMK